MTYSEQFEEARLAWHENGGIVNGHGPEYDNLVKVCRQHKLKISEVIPLLLPAVERYFAYCKQRKADGAFCESPSSFTVFTNNRRWLREYPVPRHRVNRKKQVQNQRQKYREQYSSWIKEQDEKTLREYMGQNPHMVWLVKELKPELGKE